MRNNFGGGFGVSGAFESSHMKHPDFRVRGGEVICDFGLSGQTWGMVK